MSVLLLRLAAPLQSWGDSSRFVRRETRQEPTKSGVVGLLAAAQGRRRADPIEDLAQLSFGVRIDQPGKLIRDFHTAHTAEGASMPLSYRFYLGDALFLAAVGGDHDLLTGLDEALHHPSFPLYLGRRSCPPAGPVSLGVHQGDVTQVLRGRPWAAAPWFQRRNPSATIDLEIVRDAPATLGTAPDESQGNAPGHGETVRDAPMSFDPQRREYGWRIITREWMTVTNPTHRANHGDAVASDHTSHVHDPMSLLGGI